MPDAPDIQNLSIFQGIVSFDLNAAGTFRDLGEVSRFQTTLSVERRKFYSRRSPIKSVSTIFNVQSELEVALTLWEWNPANLALALMSDVTQNTAGADVIEILSTTTITGALRLVHTNDIGQKFQIDYPSVSILPTGDIDFLQEEEASFDLQCEALQVGGTYGTVVQI